MIRFAMTIGALAALAPTAAFAHPGVHTLGEAAAAYSAPLTALWCGLAFVGAFSMLRRGLAR
jgi:hypothetical protein